MKVLLRNDIRGVGRRGDIVEVKKGFARNFLLPNGDALEANDIMEIQAASMRKARDVRDAQSREAAEVQRSLIEQAKAIFYEHTIFNIFLRCHDYLPCCFFYFCYSI